MTKGTYMINSMELMRLLNFLVQNDILPREQMSVIVYEYQQGNMVPLQNTIYEINEMNKLRSITLQLKKLVIDN